MGEDILAEMREATFLVAYLDIIIYIYIMDASASEYKRSTYISRGCSVVWEAIHIKTGAVKCIKYIPINSELDRIKF